MISPSIAALLDSAAAGANTPGFISADPVQFPRRFSSLADIEIASLLCATIAWGNRTMICRDCGRLLELMGNSPHAYTMSGEFESLPDSLNIHRTFFAANLKRFLRGLRSIYQSHPTLEEFAVSTGAAGSEAPSWHLAAGINSAICAANSGSGDSRCLPLNLRTTPLKRLNMALRWLVRDDGIVDMGVWSAIKPARLFIPLDVHVANTARALHLLPRKSNDRKAVEMLTDTLRSLRPHDPVFYDFALFSLDL